MTTPPPAGKQLTYANAGVSIDAGNDLVARIKPLVATTARPEFISGVGGFGALFEIPAGYRQPVLVSGADGVGTKLKLALDYGQLSGLGIDLVAMCANDILTCGAEPLFFLDYFATGHLDVETAAEIIAGVAQGCRAAGATLAGGETAEMPGLYGGDDFDLAGFCVGVVEKDDIIDGRDIRPGDSILGLASSGLHANGYSLVRRVVAEESIDLAAELDGRSLGEWLLEPTRIYVSAIRKLLAVTAVRGMAHITGGGLLENVPRILPPGTGAVLRSAAWRRPAIFDWLRDTGRVADADWSRTFNDGIGFVIVVPAAQRDRAQEILRQNGETVWHIGDIVEAAAPEVAIR